MRCISPVSVSWKYALRKGFEHLPVYGGPPTFFPGAASNPRGYSLSYMFSQENLVSVDWCSPTDGVFDDASSGPWGMCRGVGAHRVKTWAFCGRL